MAKKKNLQEVIITSYKGFERDWTCRGYQYEIGKECVHDGDVIACDSGFHACEYPLDVLNYYSPATSRYALVEQAGDLSRHDGDSKVASRSLTVKAEIDLPGLIKAAIEYTTSRTKASTCDSGAASNSGDRGAASNSGDSGAASNSGYRGAASNSGVRGAASNSGDSGAASNSGDSGAALSSGPDSRVESSGKHGVAVAAGTNNRVRASAGNVILIVHRSKDGSILHHWSGIAGKDCESNVWYVLDEDGKLQEVEE